MGATSVQCWKRSEIFILLFFYLILSFVCIHMIHTLMHMVSIIIPLKNLYKGQTYKGPETKTKNLYITSKLYFKIEL